MIHAEPLKFSYSDSASFSYPEIKVGANESMLILGNSGSGKTTLLHLLSGLLKPISGQVLVGSENQILSEQNDRFRGKNIGIVFQQPYFVKSLSVEQNLLIAQTMAGNAANTDAVQELLEQLGLGGRERDSINDLSVGELQRVSIARALINRPQVVLADEPTASLDDENCARVITLLARVCSERSAALIVVTHDKRLSSRFNHSISL